MADTHSTPRVLARNVLRYMSLDERIQFELNRSIRQGECWLATCYVGDDGYPRLRHKSRDYRLHRIVLERKLGRKLTLAEVARHKCHTPLCIRPEHLVPGTPADNTADAAAAGRMTRGERHWHAKLNVDTVRHVRILAREGEAIRSIARGYGLSRRTIMDVVQRRTWKHVD